MERGHRLRFDPAGAGFPACRTDDENSGGGPFERTGPLAKSPRHNGRSGRSMEMSRRRKTALIVLTAGVAALVLLVFYGPGWFIAWADDPGT
jgi:hypothetical protein